MIVERWYSLMFDLQLNGRRCVVTGGSRGIGRSVAVALAREGAVVAAIARSPLELPPLDSDRHPSSGLLFSIVGDLSTERGVEAAMGEARRALGGIDILVNNAGASKAGAFGHISDSDWSDAIELKLKGYVRCIRSALVDMTRQSSGRIINIAGLGGRLPSATYSLGALNAAILHLTASLAQDVASHGISVLAVNPGVTTTSRVQEAIAGIASARGKTIEAIEAEVLAGIPARRFASPDEVATVIVWLASNKCSYITGSSIQVDGGVSSGWF